MADTEIISQIEAAIEAAMLARSAALAVDPVPTNFRDYRCGHAGCDRSGYAGGYCNAHYMRHRSGRDMDSPIKNRKRGTICRVCESPTSEKGGWGMCFRHYKVERAATIKGVLVAEMGGRCADCGGSYPLSVYDFHHNGDKEGSMSRMISNRSAREVAREVVKCTLLCANCHRVRHANG